MHLLNTATLQVETYLDDDIPPYAILSHTWGYHEVTFADLARIDEEVSAMPGWAKVRDCCSVAIAEGFRYTWIDTCCIDKRSSAEMQEAMNSVFRWYANAEVCYVYLEDILGGNTHNIYETRWMRRGWTLMELVAPKEIVFLDKNWNRIGTKLSLTPVLAGITGIPEPALFRMAPASLSRYSIAERMSWAAMRETTRPEDRAYSLIGLFNITMPILYGEGEKAFLRLQNEIIKQTTDQSFLAWGLPRGRNVFGMPRLLPVLARSPADFQKDDGTSRIIVVPEPWSPFNHRLINSNIGLNLWLPLVNTLGSRLVFAVLNCRCKHGSMSTSAIWIPLWKAESEMYHRIMFPSASLYVEQTASDHLMQSSGICLADPPDGFERLADFNGNLERLSEGVETKVGVLVTFPIGMQSFENTVSYPPHGRNPLGLFWLKAQGDGYHQGLLVFDLKNGAKNKRVGIMFAVANSTAHRRQSWTCRILTSLDDTITVESLASSCNAALTGICNEDAVSRLPPSFEPAIWRENDQVGPTIVRLGPTIFLLPEVETGIQVLMARVVLDLPASGKLSELVSETYKQSQKLHKSLIPLERWGHLEG
jgi:hypothetical protein